MPSQPDFKEFLATAELAELGPGPRPGVQTRAALEGQLKPLLKTTELSAPRQELIRALVLLWHDHLDAAHSIAQSIDDPDGAFVHGIMHRREPDYGNAAYWFRRVGPHPAFVPIASQVGVLLGAGAKPPLAAQLVPGGAWDPFAFIDACASAARRSEPDPQLLRRIQQVEFTALLEVLQS